MIARGRSLRRQRVGSSDTETLQTDVMRFVAIIGLCLTAVFALVRSLPVTRIEAPSPEPSGAPEPQARDPRQESAEVAEELSRLRQERDETLRALEHAREQRRALAPVTQHLAALQRERDQTQQALEQARGRLQDLTERSQQAREDQRSSARELARMDRQLADRRRQLEQAHRGPEEGPIGQERAAPSEPPAAEPAPTPIGAQAVEQGFVLRFASADALDRLVRSGTVGFVAIQGQQAWKLSLSGGRPEFTGGVESASFHEMAPATVPAAYLRAFARVADLVEPTAVVWGVRLPPPIEDRVRHLTRAARGGVLVIQANGQVVLEGNHEG